MHRHTTSYSSKPTLPPQMNGTTVESELLFNSRMMLGVLLDIRHGQDTLPERLANTLRRTPSRRASWLKENTDFLRAALPYILIVMGLVFYLKEPRAFREIVLPLVGRAVTSP